MHTEPIEALHVQFEQQHAASRREPTVPWEKRANRLRRLRSLVLQNREAIAKAISADFGQRSRHETDLLEIAPTLGAIDHSLKHGAKWMRPQKKNTSIKFWPGKSYMVPQPLGVVGVVVPWNYPLYLATGPAVSALAAGNRVMIKMSEFTPRFGELFAKCVSEVFSPDEVLVINGGVDVARAFCGLPFDHLLFTGSTNVGYDVMRAASDNLTPVTLELGGKSPAIIGPDADFEKAVRSIVNGKTLNAGQTCIAPDYVLVPQGSEQRFIDSARRIMAQRYASLTTTPDYSSIISQRHFERLQRLVDEAVSAGAKAWPLSDTPHDAQRRLFTPTVLTGVPADAPVAKEEIFGPVLPVVGYNKLDDAISYINARPRPLALYIFELDDKRVQNVLSNTVSGGVTVNDTILHIAQDDLPFGGVGPSGIGAYHGEVGFRTFSHMKPVFQQARTNTAHWLYPPYGPRMEKILKWLLK